MAAIPWHFERLFLGEVPCLRSILVEKYLLCCVALFRVNSLTRRKASIGKVKVRKKGCNSFTNFNYRNSLETYQF